MADRSRTHWEGCYRDPRHHECAMERIEEMEADNERLLKRLGEMEFEYWVKWKHVGGGGWACLPGGADQVRRLASDVCGPRLFRRRLVGPWEPVEGEEVGDE